MPQLDLANFASQIFWLMITFSVLYLVTANFIIPKVEAVLTDRNKVIKSDLELAEELNQLSTNLKQKYDLDYRQIIIEANNLNQKMLGEVELAKIKSLELLQSDLLILEQKALDEIATLKNQVQLDQKNACCKLANVIITRITAMPANMDKLLEIYQEHYQ